MLLVGQRGGSVVRGGHLEGCEATNVPVFSAEHQSMGRAKEGQGEVDKVRGVKT